MIIYLVQAGKSLNGSDGYSYGLLRGEQRQLLVSFVDFMATSKQTIHSGTNVNRRKLINRQSGYQKPKS